MKFRKMLDALSESTSLKYSTVSKGSSNCNNDIKIRSSVCSHGYSVMMRPINVYCISYNSSSRGIEDKPLHYLCQKMLNIVSPASSENTQEPFDAGLAPVDEYDIDLECQVFSQAEDGDTLLHTAIIQQCEMYALLFIDICSEPYLLDIQNDLFQTALHLAVLTRQTAIIVGLVEKRASLIYQDRKGDTVLHIACRGKGNLSIVKVLAQSVMFGQSLEIRNGEGLACLHLAARGGNLELVQFLLERNADVNAKEHKTGRTVLHWAAENGNVDVLNLLFAYSDVDVNVMTYDNKTALELARGNGFGSVVMDLLHKGGNEKSDSE